MLFYHLFFFICMIKCASNPNPLNTIHCISSSSSTSSSSKCMYGNCALRPFKFREASTIGGRAKKFITARLKCQRGWTLPLNQVRGPEPLSRGNYHINNAAQGHQCYMCTTCQQIALHRNFSKASFSFHWWEISEKLSGIVKKRKWEG